MIGCCCLAKIHLWVDARRGKNRLGRRAASACKNWGAKTRRHTVKNITFLNFAQDKKDDFLRENP